MGNTAITRRTFIDGEEKLMSGFKTSKGRLTPLLGAKAANNLKLKPVLTHHPPNARTFMLNQGFPGGPEVKYLPANPGDTGLIPGLGGSHTRSLCSRAREQQPWTPPHPGGPAPQQEEPLR